MKLFKKKFSIGKIIAMAFMSFVFLFSATSCGSSTSYQKGYVCGKSTDEGSAFYEIRKVYCEQFAYNYNASLVAEGGDYYEFGAATEAHPDNLDIYSKKFQVVDGALVDYTSSPTTSDEYLASHYLFVFMENNNDLVTAKINELCNNDVTEVEKYTTLMTYCYSGKAGYEDYSYVNKVANVDLDSDDGGKSLTTVKSSLSSHSKACLVFQDEGMIDSQTGVLIPKTTWGMAFDAGLLYGLFVYPIAWLTNLFVVAFGGLTSGVGQVFAILVVTLILKIIIFLLTFKSQASTQKMQDIQPEILKIQSKYGQNPSPEDKQKMSMELMAVYQKYGVKPLAPFASMLITFPVFIAMYRAVIYLQVLRKGEIGGVVLGNNLSTYIIGGNFKVTALIIFILMAGSQILTMKLPQILNSKRMTREAKQQQKQTSMMTNVMMIMILVMGFMMPVTMSIYWIASALASIVQTVVMHYFNNANKKGGRYKVKKEEAPITIPQGYKTDGGSK